MRSDLFLLSLSLATSTIAIVQRDASSPPFTVNRVPIDPSLSSRLESAGEGCFQLNPSASCAGWPPSLTDLIVGDSGQCLPTQGSSRSFYIKGACPSLDVYICAEAGCGDHQPVVVIGSAGGCYDVIINNATENAAAAVMWNGVSVSLHHEEVLYGLVTKPFPLYWIIPFGATFLGTFILANLFFLIYMLRAHWKSRR